jgi:hypothetical protein
MVHEVLKTMISCVGHSLLSRYLSFSSDMMICSAMDITVYCLLPYITSKRHGELIAIFVMLATLLQTRKA